jgi:hypothetical protein
MVIVSLLLFAGTIVSWLVLPGTAETHATQHELEVAGNTAVKQLA